MSRVQCYRTNQIHLSRPSRHHLRIQTRSRRKVFASYEFGRRSLSGFEGRVDSHRSHARQTARRHRSAEPAPRDNLSPRSDRIARFQGINLETDHRAGQDNRWPELCYRSDQDAAPADCRDNRLGKISRRQLAAGLDSLSCAARRSKSDPNRSKTPRAGTLRRYSASRDSNYRRSETCRAGVALGRRRDGAALQGVSRLGSAQYRRLQR